jgi:hypothetical protein
MAKKFLVNIDLVQNQILNPVLQVIGSDPSSPVEGQFWYNSTVDRFRYRGNGVTRTPIVDVATDIADGSLPIEKLDTDPLDRANHTGTQTLSTISDVTASASEVNILDGATVTTAEVNYLSGVTSSIQTQLDARQPLDSDLSAIAALTTTSFGRGLLTLANGAALLSQTGITASVAEVNVLDGLTATTAELNYVDGVSGPIQTQLDAKATLESYTTATAAATVAKAVTGAEPAAGSLVVITFTAGNTAASPTVSFNGGTARPILLGGSAATAAEATVAANTEVVFHFDGTNLNMLGAQDNANTTYSAISQANIENNASTSAGLITGQRASQAVLAHGPNITVGGDLTGTVGNAQIAAGAITNADINASAAIALSKLATDPLARANHTGTQTASTISDFNTAVRTNRLDQMAAPTAAVSMNSQLITNVANPVSGTDAANKNYVDAAVAGLAWKESVRAATTANITLSGAQTIDGVSVVAGNRVLVKNQTTASQNGIYVAAAGAWARAADADSQDELLGAAVMVEEGTTNANTQWILSTDAPITVGSTNLTFVQFGGGTTYSAGNGLSLAGNAGTGLTFSGGALVIDTSVTARRYAANVGNGSSTSISVTHNFGTRDVAVDVYDSATFDTVECDVVRTNTNTVTLSFASAPASNAYRVVVVG